jgi:hypothetical protein
MLIILIGAALVGGMFLLVMEALGRRPGLRGLDEYLERPNAAYYRPSNPRDCIAWLAQMRSNSYYCASLESGR